MKLVLHSRSLHSSAINCLDNWPMAALLCGPASGLYLGSRAVSKQPWTVPSGVKGAVFGIQAGGKSPHLCRIATFRASDKARALSDAFIEGYIGAKPADELATTAVGSAKRAGGFAKRAGGSAKPSVELAKPAGRSATRTVSFATSAVALAKAPVGFAEPAGELSMNAVEVAKAAGGFATSAVRAAKAIGAVATTTVPRAHGFFGVR